MTPVVVGDELTARTKTVSTVSKGAIAAPSRLSTLQDEDKREEKEGSGSEGGSDEGCELSLLPPLRLQGTKLMSFSARQTKNQRRPPSSCQLQPQHEHHGVPLVRFALEINRHRVKRSKSSREK